mmetsp:Transcript_31187/g.85498  ORF Transcript_31187/g.85498 Transcript_31187/m.85498 type:complete len:351 (-) Transcript_31187:98-1150(-)
MGGEALHQQGGANSGGSDGDGRGSVAQNCVDNERRSPSGNRPCFGLERGSSRAVPMSQPMQPPADAAARNRLLPGDNGDEPLPMTPNGAGGGTAGLAATNGGGRAPDRTGGPSLGSQAAPRDMERWSSDAAQPHWHMGVPPKGQAAAELCCFCFSVLLAHLQGKPAPPFPPSADPLYKAPLFVTWLKRRRGDRAAVGEPVLRGCIGCLEPIAFCPGLSEYAMRSSLQDRRFPPVLLEEVPSLSCKLSILFQFEACAHIYDWELGVHGILIRFTDAHNRSFSATFLPEVALEHGMTQVSAIRELVTKSGYSGSCNEELLSRIQATRYQTFVESVSYIEYVRLGGEDLGGCP